MERSFFSWDKEKSSTADSIIKAIDEYQGSPNMSAVWKAVAEAFTVGDVDEMWKEAHDCQNGECMLSKRLIDIALENRLCK